MGRFGGSGPADSAGDGTAADGQRPGDGGRLLQDPADPSPGEANTASVVMDPTGLVLREAPPEALDSFVTPTASHYVLGHLGVARCSAEGWTLRVDGMVDRPLTLTVDQVRRRPARTVAAVLECAGNPEDPDKPTRIVSNAIWRGMPLAALLDEAGVAPGAGSVWLRGEDSGRYAGEDVPGYVKDLPLAKARDEDVLVAYEINGEPLPAEHGFPLRALVPGYYGTNSVKWLSSISVQAERPSGLFTSRLYNDEDEDGVRRPTWALAVNSRLVAPAEGEALAIGAHDVWGWAWGHEPVTEVAVSVDGGRSWRVADLERRSAGAPWQQFRTTWRPSEPGQYTILARATDSTGATQPHDVHLNQIQAVRVRVVDPGEGEPPRR